MNAKARRRASVDASALAVTLHTIAPPQIHRWMIVSLSIGIIGTAALIVGGVADPAQFFRAYLAAYLFCLDLGLGCLVALCVYHLTGGAWGFLVRRLLEAGTKTLPLAAIGFLPIALGTRYLYPFANPAAVAGSTLLQEQRGYMNEPFFCIRAAGYFAIWLGIAGLMNRWSRAQDRSGDPWLAAALTTLAGIGGVLCGVTMHLAALDWILAMEPAYHSTIMGPLVVSQQLVSGFGLTLVMFTLFCRRRPLVDLVGPKTLNDLGNMLFVFVILWSYLLWFEFMLTWIANMQVNVVWYGRRLAGFWGGLLVFLAIFQFAVPFVPLLQRSVKRNPVALGCIAAWCVLMQLVFVHFQILPTFRPAALHEWWLSLVAPLGWGGLWFAYYLFRARHLPLLPMHDVNEVEVRRLRRSDERELELEESLAHG